MANYAPESYVRECGVNALCGTTVGYSYFCGTEICSVGGDPVVANARFYDTLTITGGSGAGYLRMSFAVDGTTTLDTNLGGLTTSQGALLVQSGASYYLNSGFFGGNTTLYTSLIPFTYGVPLEIKVTSSAFIATIDHNLEINPYSVIATADFYNTITLADLAVFTNSNGTNQVNFSATSGSGTAYPTASAVSTVPEPSAILLSLLTPLALLRRRR